MCKIRTANQWKLQNLTKEWADIHKAFIKKPEQHNTSKMQKHEKVNICFIRLRVHKYNNSIGACGGDNNNYQQ